MKDKIVIKQLWPVSVWKLDNTTVVQQNNIDGSTAAIVIFDDPSAVAAAILVMNEEGEEAILSLLSKVMYHYDYTNHTPEQAAIELSKEFLVVRKPQ